MITNYEFRDGKVLMTQTEERLLNKSELLDQISARRRRKEDLVLQSQRIKEQYDAEDAAILQLETLLAQFEAEQPATL